MCMHILNRLIKIKILEFTGSYIRTNNKLVIFQHKAEPHQKPFDNLGGLGAKYLWGLKCNYLSYTKSKAKMYVLSSKLFSQN